MVSILKKEFTSFYSSFLGVGLMLILFLALGLFTWVLEGNLLDFGFAEMSVFFDIIPWFLILFIPTLTMRLFAEEKENQSIDLLKILPISGNQIIMGKVLGAFLVILVSLVPTLLYVVSLKVLSIGSELDYSIVVGQYLSLLILAFTLIQISTLASLFTSKQSVAFVVSVFCSYICWEGVMQLKSVIAVNLFDLEYFALKSHFYNLSIGVIRISELVFFLGINLILFKLEVIRFNKG